MSTTPNRMPSPPHSLTIRKQDIQSLVDLLTRYSQANQSQDNLRTLSEFRSRVQGRLNNYRNPSNQILRQLNGGGSSTDLVQIRTFEEQQMLVSVLEWGAENHVNPQLVKEISHKLETQ